jgi:hypothetical protein
MASPPQERRAQKSEVVVMSPGSRQAMDVMAMSSSWLLVFTS